MIRIKSVQKAILVIMLFAVQNIIAQTVKTFSLAELYELAIANSSQLKLAQTEVKISQSATQLVRNTLTPKVDAILSTTYIGNGVITDRDFSNSQSIELPHWGNSFGIEASQIIFAGGTISANIKKAKIEEQIAQLNYDRNELDICFLITGYYLDLYKLNNQREIFQKNIDQTKIIIDQIKSKESQGMALNSDVTRHELMLQNMELALIEVDNSSKIINQQMVVTLGLPTETIIVPDSSVLKLDLSLVTPDDLNQQATENLPELKLAALNNEMAAKDLRIARADYYPQIALVAANNFNGPILTEIPAINKNINYWYVGIGLKYNIASLYKTNRMVHFANQKQEAAKYSEALALEHTQVKVQSAYIKYRESMEKLTVYETSLKLAIDNYRIINNRYLNGLVLITEMLDASNIKLNAELQVVNAKLNVVYNYYRMQREIGNRMIK